MFVRPPAVAGRFYPDDPDELTSMIGEYVDAERERKPAIGVVAPHAGYIYSGHVAGAVYAQLKIPSRVIILCPNHTGVGAPLAIMKSGSWKTPLGELQIDQELSGALMNADPQLEDDTRAHRMEHAIEVHLPFLQVLQTQETRFVPIAIGVSGWAPLETLGKAIGNTVAMFDRSTLILASSDMNHYESDAITRVKDAMAIDPLLRLDPRELHDTVRRERVSMCGAGPATAMLVAALMLGATRANLVKYATSAEVSGDYDRVVGYAGVMVT
jgi:AmmeMemoRadiSam system protein B